MFLHASCKGSLRKDFLRRFSYSILRLLEEVSEIHRVGRLTEDVLEELIKQDKTLHGGVPLKSPRFLCHDRDVVKLYDCKDPLQAFTIEQDASRGN